MKTLATFIIATALVSTVTAAHAKGGYSRSIHSSLGSSRNSGYVYRNPYSAYPSVSVRSYTKSSGAFVMPYHRTPGNYTITDNLNYRGYGTIRVPR